MPNSKSKNLIYDRYQRCEMITFLDDGSIISKYNNRFIKFTSSGQHQDEIEFEGNLTKYLGEHEYINADSLHYDVYWHEFLF